MKFRKKPVTVEAVQWFPHLKVEGVHYRPAEIIRSIDLQLYYVWNGDYRSEVWLSEHKGTGNPPDTGVAVYSNPDGTKYWRRVFPFATFEIKSHQTHEEANLKSELFKDYGGYMKWPVEAARPVQTGWINIPGGTVTVCSSSWVVTETNGSQVVYPDHVFRETFDAVG